MYKRPKNKRSINTNIRININNNKKKLYQLKKKQLAYSTSESRNLLMNEKKEKVYSYDKKYKKIVKIKNN